MSSRNVLIIAAVACFVAALYFLAWKLLFVLALVFSSVLVATLVRTGGWALRQVTPLGERAALGVFLGLLAVVLLGVGWLMWEPAQAEAGRFTEQFTAAANDALDGLNRTPVGGLVADDLSELLGTAAEADGEPTMFDLRGVATRALGLVYGMVGALATVAVVTVAGLYLAFDPRTHVDGFIWLFPEARHDQLHELAKKLGHTLRWWLLGKLASMAIVGLLSFIALSVLGVQLAGSLAVITFFFVFIPNVGPLLSVVPPALIALSQPDGGPALVGWVLAAYLLIQVLESYLITPLIQKRAIELSPAVLIFAQVFAAALLGGLGVVLAAPLAAVGTVAVRELIAAERNG